MTTTAGPQAPSALGRTLAVVLAAVAMTAAGVLFAVSGLLVPGWAVVVLLVVWLVLVVITVRLAVRRSLGVLVPPLVAAVVWVAVVWGGEQVFGWTA